MEAMGEKKTQDALHKYLENTSEEEQREFAGAFLKSRERARPHTEEEVPPRVLRISRILALTLLGLHVVFLSWAPYYWIEGLLTTLLLVAMVCFPNQLTFTATRLVTFLSAPLRRPLTPWMVFVVAWLILLLSVLAPLLFEGLGSP